MTEDLSPYVQESRIDFESQWRRLLDAAGCRTQAELAAFLEITQPSVAQSKHRRSIPVDWLMKLMSKKNIHPDQILGSTGVGKGRMKNGKKRKISPAAPVSQPNRARDCTTDELLAELARRVRAHF